MVEPLIIGLKLSRFNLELSKAEALFCFKAYFETEPLLCVENLCLFKVKGSVSQILSCLRRFAFTKEAYVFSKNFSDLKELAKLFDLRNGKDSSFKVSLPLSLEEKLKTQNIDDLVKKVLATGLSGKVSLSAPDLVLCSFSDFFGLLVWTNKDPHSHRRVHLKPAPHPSGIDPRLARAMINLAGAKAEVLDPFCGAGGILEEIKLLGLKYVGVDISWRMINLARTNLSSRENLHCMDAFSWNTVVECLVTDLPYGKNTKLDGELKSLINRFFEHFKDFTGKVVVCCPDKYDLEVPASKNGWVLVFNADVYVHGSLTRRIHVFEKSSHTIHKETDSLHCVGIQKR